MCIPVAFTFAFSVCTLKLVLLVKDFSQISQNKAFMLILKVSVPKWRKLVTIKISSIKVNYLKNF